MSSVTFAGFEQASAETSTAPAKRARGDDTRNAATRNTTPLYIVCSPRRNVGKTLLARMLTEFYAIDGRAVECFDLADEEPQLNDYLPACTTVADIGNTSGQMALFDRLLDGGGTKVVDLSHRTFKDFFIIAQQIALFEEARSHGIEPVIMFLIDPDPKTAKAYAIVNRWFADASLLPIRNQAVARRIPYCEDFPNQSAIPVSVEIPVLGASLKAVVDERSFSFAQFWRATPVRLPERLDDELRAWMKKVFLQFREIELCLMCGDVLSALE
jgi:hypothetical protein